MFKWWRTRAIRFWRIGSLRKSYSPIINIILKLFFLFFYTSPIPNLAWGIDLGKTVDKKKHTKNRNCKFVKRYQRSRQYIPHTERRISDRCLITKTQTWADEIASSWEFPACVTQKVFFPWSSHINRL